MAARTRKIRHDENTRAKIQTSQLVNRLTDHALGKVEMSSTQVRAAEVLLSKTLPALTSAALTMSDKHDAADWTRDELVALIHDTKAGSNGAATPDGRDRESNQLH